MVMVWLRLAEMAVRPATGLILHLNRDMLNLIVMHQEMFNLAQ
jgi:hypothetical protein